jgi:hypothetical protein
VNRHWKPNKSEYRGLTPTPTAPVLVQELVLETGEWQTSEIPAEYVDALHISMGLYSGLMNISGMGRAVMLVAGYVMPEHNADPVYH